MDFDFWGFESITVIFVQVFGDWGHLRFEETLIIKRIKSFFICVFK